MKKKLDRSGIVVLDFGGQYSHLIARRVRELGVYCEVRSYRTPLADYPLDQIYGIILTGGPSSVYHEEAPRCEATLLELGVPLLGICYGAQLLAFLAGGRVEAAKTGEFGRVTVDCTKPADPLFFGISSGQVAWMSHTDRIAALPNSCHITAQTEHCIAAFSDLERKMFAVQFHPEVQHTVFGSRLLENFCRKICGCPADWQMGTYTEDLIAELRLRIGARNVICGLSGGVDSTVAAVMVHRAVGKQLTCIFVDHGMLRKNEGDEVERVCRETFDLNFVRVDAKEEFFCALQGESDPERKRRIIGETFIRVFERESRRIGKVGFLVQGTIYPDVIESGVGDSAVIKSHHNVGALPDVIDFDEIVEPLALLFKDEVRAVGLELGIDPRLVWRQPFPGPGLAVRILGEVTPEKVALLQEADAIFREEVAALGLDFERSLSQYFAVLTNVRSVGVMGDGRTYAAAVALRAVATDDFMTAEFVPLPWELLGTVGARIVNEVPGVNRVVYDITAKPPGTIEWE